MELRKEDLPATIQAFDLQNNEEIFIAEQIVNDQAEIEAFTTRYAGKLIKAKTVVVDNRKTVHNTTNHDTSKRNNNAVIVIIILVIIAAAIAYGFYTGWIQEQINTKA